METGLRLLGLGEYESKVYRTLLECGRMNAREISRESGVPLTAVYPSLRSLRQRNLIQQLEGEVRHFEVLSPEIALPAFIERQKKGLAALQESLVSEAAEMAHRKQVNPEKEVVSVSLGREASSAIYQESLKRAKASYYILGWYLYKVKDKYQFLHQFRAALKRGVDLRIILTGEKEKNWQLVDDYLKAGIKMRYLPLSNFSILVVDGQECKITLKNRELPQKMNLHILDSSLALALHSYFLSMWRKAQLLNPGVTG